MPAWALLALVALAALAAYSVAMKWLITREEAVDPVLLASVVFALVGAGAAGVWLGLGDPGGDLPRLAHPRALGLAALDAALYTAAPILYFRALAALPVSQVAVMHALIGVFALLGGVLLGLEALSVARVAGAGLIVAAVALASGPATRWRPGPPTLLLLGATLLYGAAALVDQQLIAASGLSPPLVLAIAFLPPGLALLGFGLARAGARRDVLVRVLRRRSIVLNAAALATSYGCVYQAYDAGGPASGVTLVLAAEAVVVVVLGALLLRERERLARKLAAGVVVVVGVALVG